MDCYVSNYSKRYNIFNSYNYNDLTLLQVASYYGKRNCILKLFLHFECRINLDDLNNLDDLYCM